VFAQYLTTTRIPVFEYTRQGTAVSYHWANVVPGFEMPVKVWVAPGNAVTLNPTEAWQTMTVPDSGSDVRVDENYYVVTQRRASIMTRPAATTASLDAVSVAPDGTIWAAGRAGTIVRSVDGGATWTAASKIRDAGQRDVHGLEAISGTTAYALVSVPDTGWIYRTIDAGRTWTRQYRRVAERGVVLAGFAGRQPWVTTRGDTTSRIFHASHAAATPIRGGSPSAGIAALAFADSLHGIAVGGDPGAPDEVRVNVALTVDGGRTWTRGDTTGVVKYVTGVAYLRGSTGRVVVAVGPRGVFRSRDGGLTWDGVDTQPYNSVAATPKGFIMVGDRGAIATWDGSGH
jgi:photosystem II stability/assembly factor-like uncharacterized protein